MSALLYELIKFSGRKRLEIQRSWKGTGPSTLIQHTSTSPELTHMVHRIKVDELAGYIMTTSNKGGLLVTDLNEDRVLWALPQVCKQYHHYHLFYYLPQMIVVCPSICTP